MKQLTVFYDPHCPLCQQLRKWFLRIARNPAGIIWEHYRDAPLCGLDSTGCGETMAVVTQDGRHYQGFYAIRCLLGCTWLCFLQPLLYLPGAAWLGEKGYAWIARNRYHIIKKKM